MSIPAGIQQWWREKRAALAEQLRALEISNEGVRDERRIKYLQRSIAKLDKMLSKVEQ